MEFSDTGPGVVGEFSITRTLPRGAGRAVVLARDAHHEQPVRVERERRHASRLAGSTGSRSRVTFSLSGSYEHYESVNNNTQFLPARRTRGLVQSDHRARSTPAQRLPGHDRLGRCETGPVPDRVRSSLHSDFWTAVARVDWQLRKRLSTFVYLRYGDRNGDVQLFGENFQQVQRWRRLPVRLRARPLAAGACWSPAAPARSARSWSRRCSRAATRSPCWTPSTTSIRARRRSGTWRARAASAASPASFEGDIRDVEFVAKTFESFAPRAVVHLAARAGVRPSLEDPVTYTDVNLLGTSVVLNAATRAGVERFVFASSSSVYGERPRGEFSGRPRRRSAARALRRDQARRRAALPRGAGEQRDRRHLPALLQRLRPAHAPGPGDPQVRACSCWRADPIPVYGDGSAERDFTFVVDTVDGIVRALDRARGFSVYNLGRGKPVTLNEIIAALERALGIRAERQTLPDQPGDIPRTWASIARARAELGYAPRSTSTRASRVSSAWLRGEELRLMRVIPLRGLAALLYMAGVLSLSALPGRTVSALGADAFPARSAAHPAVHRAGTGYSVGDRRAAHAARGPGLHRASCCSRESTRSCSCGSRGAWLRSRTSPGTRWASRSGSACRSSLGRSRSRCGGSRSDEHLGDRDRLRRVS